MKKKVVFLCVHNSCRSQIAEALTKKYGGDTLEVYSAGTETKDRINPDAVRLMKELYDIDMELEQKPKLIAQIPPVDYVITMGCNVVCPSFSYKVAKEDWGLDDPTGKSDEEFKKTIQLIENKVLDFIKQVGFNMITYQELRECQWNCDFEIEIRSKEKISLRLSNIEVQGKKYQNAYLIGLQPSKEWARLWVEESHEWIDHPDKQSPIGNHISAFAAKMIGDNILVSFGGNHDLGFARWGFYCKELIFQVK